MADLTEETNTMGIEQLLLERAEKLGEKKGEKKGALKERARIERLLAKAEAERAKAEAERVKASALKMKNSGFSYEMISDILGLSIDEIEKL